MPKRNFALLTCGALLTGATVLISAACSGSAHQQAVDAAPAAPAVAVAKAQKEDLSRRMVLTAEFKPFQEIDLMSKVAGYVQKINVDVGDHVKQGQLLAVLEVPEMANDLTRGEAAVNRSRAEVSRAEDDLHRTESAHQNAHLAYQRLADVGKTQKGLVAQQEIDDAQSKDLVAEAQVAGAKSNLAASQQQVQVSLAELQKVKTLFDYARVTAPFSGVITKRYADTGSMIQAGTSSSTQVMPLVKLSENSLLRLILPVPESAVPTVHIGQQVEVRVPSLKRSFPGRVARFSDKVASATRTMDAEVDVPNPSLILVPGMFAEVDLALDRHDQALTVPAVAVDMGGDESSGKVALVTPNDRVTFRTVQLGIQNADNVEIKSGLNPGDMVVTGNRGSLREGQQVRPKFTQITTP